VVVAGLDFAYGIGAYHARSAPSRVDRLCRTDRLKSLIDPAPAFRDGTQTEQDKRGGRTRTDPALRGYRALFEREFSSHRRIFDAGPRGLDLGIAKVSIDEAERLLDGFGKRAQARPSPSRIADTDAVVAFIERETERLGRLRAALTGESGNASIEADLDACDYLWAHFPECAGAGGKRPPISNLSFLKRVRAEIDPFVKAFGIALSELRRR
jgi:hypothetical protein